PLRTGLEFNQGRALIEKSPPNRVKIQSRKGPSSRLSGQISILQYYLTFPRQWIQPSVSPSVPRRRDRCPSRKQYICNCRNRYNSSDKLCKWYTHCAVMVWVTLLYIKAVR